MRSKNQSRLNLESLESRWVPATVSVSQGNLFVSNQVGNLTITQTATPGAVQVVDGATNTVFNNVTKLISVTGTNANNNITLIATAAPFNGNVLVNAGNGNDGVTLQGTFGGNVQVLGGLGDDAVGAGAALTIGGNFQVTDTAGSNDLNLTAATTVGGTLNGTGLNDVDITAATSVGQDLSLSALNGGPRLDILQTADLTVGRTYSVRGFSAADQVIATGVLNVTGNTSIDLGTMENVVALNVAVGSTLNGDLIFAGGIDDAAGFRLGANLTVGGSFNANISSSPGVADLASSAVINGPINITGGNAGNALAFAGTINGTVTLNLGNGVNTTTFNSVPSGLLTYRGGNNNNTLTLNGAATDLYEVNITFGNLGTQQLTLNTAAITGRAISGTPATSTFTNNGTVVDPFTINF